MIATVRPKRIEIYPNPYGKSMAQVKKETGCTHILNGGSFDDLNTPNCQLKINGRVYVDDGYTYWAYAWDTAEDFSLAVVPCNKANYIALICMLRDGQNEPMIIKPAYAGCRQRTAIGRKADGSIVLYCTQSGRYPEQVRDEMRAAGCVDALLLDSGLSSQCDFDGQVLYASRKVHNFICIWAETETGGDTVAVLKKGSSGAEVYALQSDLNLLGANLSLDGSFGAKTEAAVKSFQSDMSLSSDGIVGSITKEVITTAIKWTKSENPLVLKAGIYIGISEPDGDNAFIDTFNELAGSSFGHSESWCQMFAVVCMSRVDLEPFVTASCTLAYRHYQSIGAVRTSPQPGYLVYFDWDRSGDADHVGIISTVENGYIYVIEGNSSGKGEDAVRIKRYKASDTRIRCFVDPEADAGPIEYFTVKLTRAGAEKLARDYGGEVVKFPG